MPDLVQVPGTPSTTARSARRRRAEGHRHRSRLLLGRHEPRHHEAARPSRCPASPDGLLVEHLQLLHQAARSAAARRRPELAGPRAGRRRGLQLLPAADRICSSRSGRQDPPPGLRHGTDAARGGADRDRADASVCDQHRHRARAGSGQHRPGRHAGLDVGQGPERSTPSARSPRAPRPAASRSRRPRRSSDVTWDMGDGTEVVCNTAGTPYKPAFGRKDSPDCGHTYKKSSARPDR